MPISDPPTRVSATVIAFNEERRIGECLDSLRWADEIIVIDSGSQDRTVEIARERGALVFHHDWQGFSVQKNYALSLATCDWILHLDADERVTPDLRDEVLDTIAASEGVDGYFVPRLNHWLGYPIRHGGWYPDYSLRLFRRGKARSEGLTHEQFVINGATGRLKQPLLHFSYGSVKEHVLQILQSTPLDVHESLDNGLRLYRIFPWHLIGPLVWHISKHGLDQLSLRLFFKQYWRNRIEVLWLVPFMPLLRFFYNYVLRHGYRDGIPGFWVAIFSAYYEAVRLALLWEQLGARRSADSQDVLRRSSRVG